MSLESKPWHFPAAAILFAATLAGHHTLIRLENQQLEKQLEHITQQLDQQAQGHTRDPIRLRDRRYELLNLIYGKAPTPRARAEAVREFIEIERERGVTPNLRRAPLKELDLRDFDFHEVDLREAQLVDVDLTHANLGKAMLQRARLNGADLRDADLSGADLRGARLRSAGIFYNARNLTQSQLDTTVGDFSTELPSSLKRPSHWTP